MKKFPSKPESCVKLYGPMIMITSSSYSAEPSLSQRPYSFWSALRIGSSGRNRKASTINNSYCPLRMIRNNFRNWTCDVYNQTATRIFWLRLLISPRMSGVRSPLTENARALGTRLWKIWPIFFIYSVSTSRICLGLMNQWPESSRGF